MREKGALDESSAESPHGLKGENFCSNGSINAHESGVYQTIHIALEQYILWCVTASGSFCLEFLDNRVGKITRLFIFSSQAFILSFILYIAVE